MVRTYIRTCVSSGVRGACGVGERPSYAAGAVSVGGVGGFVDVGIAVGDDAAGGAGAVGGIGNAEMYVRTYVRT